MNECRLVKIFFKNDIVNLLKFKFTKIFLMGQNIFKNDRIF
jgi:hypothetical protein